MDLMQLTATLGLDASGFEAGVNKSRGIFGGLSGTISAGTIALGNLMADVVKKGASMVVDLGKTAIDYNMQMEDYTANFRVMLGSTEAAAAKVEALKEFAAKTPFEMTDLASATQTLLAFGIEAERTDGIMQMLGDVSLGNSQKFASLATVFGQVSSSGKLLGQDLLQFINQGFNPLQVIAEKTGASMGDLKNVMSGQKTSKEFNNMVKAAQKEVKKLGDGASDSAKLLAQIGEDGMISAEMVEEAFRIATEEGGQFYKGMEESSKTLSGLMSTLSDNWTALVGDVFKPVSDFLQTTLIPRAIEAVGTLQNAFDEGGFRGMLSAAVGLIQPYVDSAFEALSAIATNAFDTGANILAGVYNGLTGGNITAEDVKLVFSGIGETIGKTFESVVTLGGSVLSGIYYALTGDEAGAAGITSAIQSVFDDPQKAIDALIKDAGGFFSSVWAALQGDSEAMESVKKTLGDAFSFLPETLGKIVTNAGNLFTDILAALGADAQTQEEIKGAIAGVFSSGAEAVSSFVQTAGGVFTTILDALTGDETVAQGITQAFVDSFDGAADVIADVVEAGGKMISSIGDALVSDESGAAGVVEAIQNVLSDAKGVIDTFITSAGSFFTTAYAALQGDTQAQSDFSAMLSSAFDGALGAVESLAESAGNVFTKILAALTGDETVAQGITQAFNTAFDGAADVITGLVTSGSEMIGAITTAIADPQKALALYEAVKTAFDDAVSYIAGIPASAAAWGASLITNFINGLMAKYEELKWKVIDAAGQLKNLFSGGPSIEYDSGGKPTGHFAVGLDYVPRDNFPAMLHRGEAVLTRREAEDWRAGEGSRGTTTIVVNQYINSEAQTAADLMREARWEQERGVLLASV